MPGHDGDAFILGECGFGESAGAFALEGAGVKFSFAGDEPVTGFNFLREVEPLGDEVEAGKQLDIATGAEAEGDAACGSASGDFGKTPGLVEVVTEELGDFLSLCFNTIVILWLEAFVGRRWRRPLGVRKAGFGRRRQS